MRFDRQRIRPLHGGDLSPTTAYVVFVSIQAAVRFLYGSDFKDVRVAVQGVGKVGYHLVRRLVAAGAEVVVDEKNLARVVNEFEVAPSALPQITCAEVDVFAPCALGGVINNENALDK